MLLSVAQIVNERSSAYTAGQWTGRLVLLALAILLVRKYIFKRDSPVLRLPRRAHHSSPQTVVATSAAQEKTLQVPARDILPTPAGRHRRRT